MSETVSKVVNKVPMANNVEGVVTPLRDLVYVEPELLGERKTESGIMLSTPKRQGVPNTGWVRYLGPDVKLDLKVGDKVIVNDPNMRGTFINGVAIVTLEEKNIVARIENE